jgi:hypothetical protein
MAYNPYLQTKQNLKDYILRRLGFPVVNIELVDAMLDDRIDDTIEQYMQRAYSGVTERYVLLPLLANITSYTLPYDVFAILEIMGQGMLGITNSTPSNLFSLNQFIASDLYRGAGKIDLLTYELTNQMLQSMEIIFTNKITFDFNCISKELNVFSIPVSDQMVMLHCYKKNVPKYTTDVDGTDVEDTNIYSELWIRNMAYRQCQYQWASNLLKYSGSALPNGLQLAVPEILAEAKEGIAELKEELSNYELPIDFMIG